MHRRWAGILIAFAVALVAAIAVVGWLRVLSTPDLLAALVVPALAPLKEIGEQIKANWEAAHTKEGVERKVDDMWTKGMSGSRVPSEDDLRSVQDKLLLLRQSNPYVPDWLDNAFREKSQAAMRSSAQDKVAQARRCGHAD